MKAFAPLWKFAEVNPETPEFKSLADGTDVAFMPLEAIWPGANCDYSRTLPWSPKLSYTQFRRGDILVPKITPTFEAGRTIIADIPSVAGLASTEVHVVRANDGADPRFLKYTFQSQPFLDEGAHSLQGVGNLRRITPRFVQDYKVLDASRDDQALLSDYLDRETGEIEEIIGKLDDLAGILRNREAVVRTRLVCGLSASHNTSQLSAHSPLSGIPDHWDRTKFGYDFTESTERNGDDPPGPLLSISEYRGVELNTRTDGQQASLDVSKYRVVRPGQLAANMMWLNHGGLGVSSLTGYISPDYKAFWISDRFEPRYVHHLFRSSRYIDYFAAIATGVRPNAQRVTKTVLDATPVPLPPLDEQIRIADELDKAAARVDDMLTKVADLKSLLLVRRAALITDVVTGKKEVA
ncbi:restriction endonuclease subunit S [Streptomyces ardesiacus]|uniref:restriction endonuclease subunit S n=1 Tax=Streptomyces ardesiacus TaxID=285564 RepID=UPI00365FC490